MHRHSTWRVRASTEIPCRHPSRPLKRCAIRKRRGGIFSRSIPGSRCRNTTPWPSLRTRWASASEGMFPADVGLEHAIEMGQETFDHLDGFIEYLNAFDEPVDRLKLGELVAMVRQADAWVVPTMVLWDVGIIGRGDGRTMANYPEMRYWPKRTIPSVVEGVEGWLGRHAVQAREREADPETADLWANNRLEVLKALSDGGVGVLLGTGLAPGLLRSGLLIAP